MRKAVLALVALLALAALSPVAARDWRSQRCFGAASRDPQHRCQNPALRLVVTPMPRQASNRPNAPCRLRNPNALIRVCEFGVPKTRAKESVALLGDSHAAHWRAALAVVAAAKRWHGLSLVRAGCPFSSVGRALRAELRRDCRRWKQRLPTWFAAHPNLHTVFVVAQARSDWLIPAGRDPYRARVLGFIGAWRTLPKSVTEIVVIRDTPVDDAITARCVESAVAQRRPAGRVCALRRSVALERDPAVDAAARIRSGRVRAVGLTRFFCDRRRCFPVVGGALVHKDTHHLTTVFARSLGPYLLRSINRLRRLRGTPAESA